MKSSELYLEQKKRWPKSGKRILADYDEQTGTIVVYQAYKSSIADAIVKTQNFHADECIKSGYSLNRMSWIKTSFLWMMYRSGWAMKENQERILAIRIKLAGFEEILTKAVLSSHHSNDDQQWKESVKTSDVRLQWDPDHLPNGEKDLSGRRAIQLGLRNEMLLKLSKEFIVSIEDITEFVNEQHQIFKSIPDQLRLPVERPYVPADEKISQLIELDTS